MPASSLMVFYDGQCPFCRSEIAWLRRRDRHGRISFRDIADPAFEPTDYGLTRQAVDAELHALTADGRLLRRVDAIQAVYRAIGWGWLVAPLSWPGLHAVCDGLYGVFARHRVRWGRLFGRTCDSGTCGLPR